MIKNDTELKVTQDRISRFHEQVTYLRQVEADPQSYHAQASGFLTEIDRMQLEVRAYLMLHPLEMGSK